MKQSEWPGTWTEVIGQAVRKYRDELDLSAAELAERCTELGQPIPRNTITNLENGRKASLPVHELVVIARALEMSPVELLAPLDVVDTVETSPGQVRPTFDVAEWISGNHSSVEDARSVLTTQGSFLVDAMRMGKEGETLLDLWREHQRLVEAYAVAVDRMCEFQVNVEDIERGERPVVELFGAEPESKDVWVERVSAMESNVDHFAEALAILRRRLRAQEDKLPPLLGMTGRSLIRHWKDKGIDAAVGPDEFERANKIASASTTHSIPPLDPGPELVFPDRNGDGDGDGE